MGWLPACRRFGEVANLKVSGRWQRRLFALLFGSEQSVPVAHCSVDSMILPCFDLCTIRFERRGEILGLAGQWRCQIEVRWHRRGQFEALTRGGTLYKVHKKPKLSVVLVPDLRMNIPRKRAIRTGALVRGRVSIYLAKVRSSGPP